MSSLWSRIKAVFRGERDPRAAAATERYLATEERFQDALSRHKLQDLPLKREAVPGGQRARNGRTVSPKTARDRMKPLLKDAFADAEKRGVREFADKLPADKADVLAKVGARKGDRDDVHRDEPAANEIDPEAKKNELPPDKDDGVALTKEQLAILFRWPAAIKRRESREVNAVKNAEMAIKMKSAKTANKAAGLRRAAVEATRAEARWTDDQEVERQKNQLAKPVEHDK